MASSSVGRRPSGQRWPPGTSRVAPLASVAAERPHAVDHHRVVGPGQRVDVLVAVEHLGLLARADLQRHRRRELVVGAEGVVERRQQQGVHGQVVEGPGLGVHRVDALRVEALEEVAAGGRGREQVGQRRQALVDVRGREHALDQRVAVLVERGGDVAGGRAGPEAVASSTRR